MRLAPTVRSTLNCRFEALVHPGDRFSGYEELIRNVSPQKKCTVRLGGEIAYFYETQAADSTNLVVTKPDI